MLRTASVEAIAKSLGAKTATWYGRDHRGRIPADEAAAALCGLSSVECAFLRASWGHPDESDLETCRRVLRAAVQCREIWGALGKHAGRGRQMVELALQELQLGHAAGRISEEERARIVGVSRATWYRCVGMQYAAVSSIAHEIVSSAHANMMRRQVAFQ